MNTETQPLPTANPQVLQAFARSLGREAHVLTREPSLLWQQMYNRLQWEGEEINNHLSKEFILHSSPGNRMWVKFDSPIIDSDELIRVIEETELVETCHFSSDGHFILSASGDHNLHVWEFATGLLIRTLQGHTDSVYACGFSPDDRLIVSISKDNTMKVWDTDTGQVLRQMEGILTCTFSPDGNLIASAGKGFKLCLWDAESGKLEKKVIYVKADGTPFVAYTVNKAQPLRTLEHTGPILSCSFSPDGKQIVSASADKTLRVWEVESGILLHVLAGHTDKVRTCSYSPDGRFIVSGGSDKTVRLWDACSADLLLSMEGHQDTVYGCAFSPDGLTILSAGGDCSLRVWDSKTGQNIRVLESHANLVKACSFSPDGRFFVSGSWDKSLRLWNSTKSKFSPAPACKAAASFEGHANRVQDCSFSPDGKSILSASFDGTLRIWNALTGKTVRILEGHTSYVVACAFSPDGGTIISGGMDNHLRVWDAGTGFPHYVLQGHTAFVSDCAYSPSGNLILSTSEDGTWKLWNPVDYIPIRTVKTQSGGLQSCAFSPDSRWFVTCGTYEVNRWDTATGKLLHSLKLESPRTKSCSISPDGSRILITGIFGGIHVRRSTDFHLQGILTNHQGCSFGCAFTPDGNYIVSISEDKSLVVWETQTLKPAIKLPLPGPFCSIGFHPWLSQFICGNMGKTMVQMELMGMYQGPTIITARNPNNGLDILCPSCQTRHPITQSQLGSELICPTPGCGLQLKINPFVIKMA